MKNLFTIPEIEVCKIICNDVVCTSGYDPLNPDEKNNGNIIPDDN